MATDSSFWQRCQPINVNYFLGNILDSSSIFPFLSSTFTSYSNIIDYCTMCMDLIENGNMFSKQTCLQTRKEGICNHYIHCHNGYFFQQHQPISGPGIAPLLPMLIQDTYLTLLCLCTYISWNLCCVALSESAILNMIFLFT